MCPLVRDKSRLVKTDFYLWGLWDPGYAGWPHGRFLIEEFRPTVSCLAAATSRCDLGIISNSILKEKRNLVSGEKTFSGHKTLSDTE